MTQPDLWQRIAQFELDSPDSSFTFSDRLARENGWSKPYTFAVIEEYKRFIYLCAISDYSITPSDPVDQAWHLHLTYTQSYWVDFCHNTIGKEIHHGPTKGGQQERGKFKNWYALTFELYQKEFGMPPPENIWWSSERRFKEIHFTRVNRSRFWLIPKPGEFSKRQMALAIFILMATGFFTYAIDGFYVFFIALVTILMLSAIFGKGKKGNRGGDDSDLHDSQFDSGDDGGDSGCGDSGCGGCGGCGD